MSLPLDSYEELMYEALDGFEWTSDIVLHKPT